MPCIKGLTEVWAAANPWKSKTAKQEIEYSVVQSQVIQIGLSPI